VFTRFARRLTFWYVAAAVALVFVIAFVAALVAMSFYARIVSDGISDGAREAAAFAARAAVRHQTFESAAVELEHRDHRTGVVMYATRRPPAPAGERGRPDRAPIPYTIVNGQVVHQDVRTLRFASPRLGLSLATAFGTRTQRIEFLDGDLQLSAAAEDFQRIAVWLLAGIILVSAVAGVLAWFGGRYITRQVLDPLIEVTHALQRFAARDFRPHPVAVAGKSEFDAIALAYNAAASQVAAAFVERQQAETQMRQFVADAGHELRTPLTIVLGYIDLLRRRADAGDERSRRIFSAIGIEGARMRTLIDNLVLLARMEGEDVRPPEPFELCPLLEQIVDARKLLHPGLPIALDCAVDATVIGDLTEIHEAIANVVDNAIKYAPGAAVRIVADASGDGGVEVTVADQGPGIHPDDRESIFDRFYRGATRGDVEGSGLGLAIAKRAVERAGGTLVLASSSAAGTTFVLRLRADQVRKRERTVPV
jgi:two-component system OmpR family sensor kinase